MAKNFDAFPINRKSIYSMDQTRIFLSVKVDRINNYARSTRRYGHLMCAGSKSGKAL